MSSGKARGRKQGWAIQLRDIPEAPPTTPAGPAPFTKLVVLYVPRRFVTGKSVDVPGFIASVNETIVERGFVMYDGQVLTTPLTATEQFGVQADGDIQWEVPPFREWGPIQQKYFGLRNPYQMVEDRRDYTQSQVFGYPPLPYLSPDERIAGIVHGVADDYYVYCRCHDASIVYTTRQRLVCMSCGSMHMVLQQSLAGEPARMLTAEDWKDFFDDCGSRRDEEIELSVVDFRTVEAAETIWTTDAWDEARNSFVFLARSSPEAVDTGIRRTERDASLLQESGFLPFTMAPPIAEQVSEDSVDLGLVENAMLALDEGTATYLGARDAPELLATAIPQLFRALELLLKAKLHEHDPKALDRQPNNPAVLKRLASSGCVIADDELQMIAALRRLRNALQHGVAKFNQRTGLYLCRKAVIFADRFAQTELGVWIGDEISPDHWHLLLSIPELAATADSAVGYFLERVRKAGQATISACERCTRDAVVRFNRRPGANCLYCHYVPVRPR